MPRRSLAILPLLAGAIALARLSFLHDLPEWDQSTYFLIGDAILHGKKLYLDIWDMKPPAIYATYAAAGAVTRGSFAWSSYVLAVVAAIGTMISLFIAGLRFNIRAALLAAALWTTVSMQPALDGAMPNTEAFINLFVAAGFAVWLWRGERVGGSIAGGALFALATLYKQVAIAPAIAVSVANVLRPAPGVSRRSAGVRSVLMLATIPAFWLLCSAYFALTGRGSIFYVTNFVYPRFYSGNLAANLLRPLSFGAMCEILPLAAIAVIGLMMLFFRKFGSVRDRALVVALFIGVYVAVAMPGQSFEHYLQLWLVPLSIAGGIAADKLLTGRLGLAAVATIFAALLALQFHWYTLSPRNRAARQHPASFYLNCVDVGDELRTILHDDETMYGWCDEVYLYVLAGKRPTAAGLWKSHTVLGGPISTWLTQRTVDDLSRSPPDLVVLWAFYPGPEDHPIYQWIADRYDPIPGNEKRFPLALLARRGSELHHRTISAPSLAP